MMMKLLPLVAQAIAERRFLAAKKSDARYFGGDLIFDKEVSTTDFPYTNIVFYAEGTTKIGSNASGNAKLLESAASLAKDGGATPTADEKKVRRLPKATDGSSDTAWEGMTQTDTNVASCDNTFYASGGTEIKDAGVNPSTDSSSAASANLELTFLESGMTAANFAVDKHLTYFCRSATATNCAKSLTSGTTYKVKTSASDSGTTTVTLADSAGTVIKGSDANGVKANLWFLQSGATATGPKSITLCATGKGSSARSAAFVAGLMAYAMLM